MGRVLTLLLCLLPHADRPTFDEPEPVARVRCTEIEVNTTYDWDERRQKLCPRFHQIIGWKKYHGVRVIGEGENVRAYVGGRHVVTYHLIVPDSVRVHYRFPFTYVRAKLSHGRDGWVEYYGLRRRRTHTFNDPEMDDRDEWPLELRDNDD